MDQERHLLKKRVSQYHIAVIKLRTRIKRKISRYLPYSVLMRLRALAVLGRKRSQVMALW